MTATDDGILRITDDASVRILTVNRPAAKNAFNAMLYRGIGQALVEASMEPAVKVCVMTGQGDVFSAGQDLKELAKPEERAAASKAFEPFTRALAAFEKPLLGAVNGPAVGVGTTLLLHCDVVLAAPSARFRLPFANLGLVPEAGSTVLLPDRIGPQAAAYHLLTGDWIVADEAVRLGLAWKVCATGALMTETLSLAHRIAEAAREPLMATKQLLLAARADAVAAALGREQQALGAPSLTPAHARGDRCRQETLGS
jgi:enoyl-CoA hydratase/carnithine racemase